MAPENKPVAASALTIRPFRPTDSPTIVEILRDSTEAAQWPAESYATLAASPPGLLLVCEASARVIGFLAARQTADEAEILNIAVHKDFRRQGAASTLLVAALDKFQRSGVVSVFLELRASNLVANAPASPPLAAARLITAIHPKTPSACGKIRRRFALG
jgi:ribosomal-protein-alanine N-acetyltransferase